MRKRIALIAAVAVAAAAAATAHAATKSVKVGDNWFVKAKGVPTVTVNRGDTVRWQWVGERPHNVRVQSGPVRFASKVQESGTFSRRMTRSGTYTIICVVHGASDQKMTLRVR